jgi:formylglycine-generating enzyme required for sulfatase activity
MSGNVFEWCSDFYGQYMADEQTNPEGPASGSERILRGGGWMSDTDFCRSAYRESYNPASNYSDIGFRLVTE